MALCDRTCDPQCYACTLRAKNVGISRTVIPNRIANGTKVFTKHSADPAWERGVAGEVRSDGSFMPYLDAGRAPMGVKERGERRHDVDAQVRQLKSDPSVFKNERSD